MLVTSLRELEPGDHVSFNRGLYHHHAIVEYIDYRRGTVTVIDYAPDPNENRSKTAMNSATSKLWKATISRKTLTFIEENFIKVIHEWSLRAREVIARARSRIGEESYNVFVNNCEHFANWCKEGKSRSEQATNLAIGVGVTAGIGALIGALWTSQENKDKKK